MVALVRGGVTKIVKKEAAAGWEAKGWKVVDEPAVDRAASGGPSAAAPRGSANPATRRASARGSRLHADRPGNLPDQLRQRYPETEFKITNPGRPGQDVQFVGGKHPSEYPNSDWPQGIDHADFKPNSPGGKKTFASDQKKKWQEPTHMIPYDPSTGEIP